MLPERLASLFLVENSALVRERLVRLVDDHGGVKVVGQAEGEEEAREGIQREEPDIVILDLQLARGNGLGLLDGLVQLDRKPLVVVLTNHATPQYRARCLHGGADYFFDKTAEFHRVLDVLEEFVQTRACARDTSAV